MVNGVNESVKCVSNLVKVGICDRITIPSDMVATSLTTDYFKNEITKNGMKISFNNREVSIEYPKVTDVNVIVQNKVVEVTFADGTKEKSVCREPDVFSLESAISICISKKIMGGSGAYNNAVKCGMKVYEDKLKKEATDKAEQERIAKKREKRLAYKKRRANEKAETEKERQIEIQKEAYLRAMDILRIEGCTVAN